MRHGARVCGLNSSIHSLVARIATSHCRCVVLLDLGGANSLEEFLISGVLGNRVRSAFVAHLAGYWLDHVGRYDLLQSCGLRSVAALGCRSLVGRGWIDDSSGACSSLVVSVALMVVSSCIDRGHRLVSTCRWLSGLFVRSLGLNIFRIGLLSLLMLDLGVEIGSETLRLLLRGALGVDAGIKIGFGVALLFLSNSSCFGNLVDYSSCGACHRLVLGRNC